MSDPTAQPSSGPPPIVRLTSEMIRDAIVEGASEILLEAQADSGSVRFRVNDELVDHLDVAAEVMPRIMRRIGVMSGLDLLSRWMDTQKGLARVRIKGQPYALAVTYEPSGTRDQMSMRMRIDRVTDPS